MYVYVILCLYEHPCTTAQVQRSEDNLWMLILSFYLMGPKDWTQVGHP